MNGTILRTLIGLATCIACGCTPPAVAEKAPPIAAKSLSPRQRMTSSATQTESANSPDGPPGAKDSKAIGQAAAPDQGADHLPADAGESAEALLQRIGKFYRSRSDFRVQSRMVTTIAGAPVPGSIRSTKTIQFSRPDRLSFVGSNPTDLTTVSDGEHLTLFVPQLMRYTRQPAPKTLEDLLKSPLASIPGGPVASFALHLAAEDPVEALMAGVTKTRRLESAPLNGTPAEIIEFIQSPEAPAPRRGAPLTLTLWFASAGDPVLLQARIETETRLPRPAPAGAPPTLTVTEVLDGWEFDCAPPDAAFQFAPPAQAREVEDLFEGLSRQTPPPS